MKRVDGFLSRKAQATWPTALVYCEEASSVDPVDLVNRFAAGEPEEEWTMDRKGTATVGLGHSFNDAKQAVEAMAAAERASHRC